MSTSATPASSASPYSPLAVHWTLDRSVTFLNHGSFGACPASVLAVQAEFRARLEAEPVRFFIREAPALLDHARERLARVIGAKPKDLVFVHNATSGVNAVVRSLTFKPGDELLATDHGYNACNNVLTHVAGRSGAKVVVAKVPFPLASEDDAVSAILAAVTPRTRFALIDHVTSPTAFVLPVKRIVRELAARGIDTMIDGAHAPGMVPLDLADIGAAYYTGNCHKWLCAPKGAALLWIREDRQESPAPIHPPVISHGYNDQRPLPRIWREFDWAGTDDPSAALCLPAALDFMEGVVPGGLAEVMRRNRATALEQRQRLGSAFGTKPLCPESMIGSIASIALPPSPPKPTAVPSAFNIAPLQEALWERHRIEVPIIGFPAPPARQVRISAQLYNGPEQYALLERALREEIARGV